MADLHITEPWTFTPGKNLYETRRILSAGGRVLASAIGKTSDKNFARIVACVNALAGIADPAAFMSAVRELRDAIEKDTGGLMWAAHKLIALLPEETAS